MSARCNVTSTAIRTREVLHRNANVRGHLSSVQIHSRTASSARIALHSGPMVLSRLHSGLRLSTDVLVGGSCGTASNSGATRRRNNSSCRTSSPSGQRKIRCTPATAYRVNRSAHTSAGPIGRTSSRIRSVSQSLPVTPRRRENVRAGCPPTPVSSWVFEPVDQSGAGPDLARVTHCRFEQCATRR